MDGNIFFDSKNKFNPDIDGKLLKKKNDRKATYKLKNKIDKPIIKGEIKYDTPVDIKSRVFHKQQERTKLDAELANKKYNHKNVITQPNYNHENVARPKISTNKNIKKSDKILEDLKALGIIK